jgi:predicted amidophosphoribosyltransferase
MTETAVQTPQCETCNADVRSESLFCYNCGAAVTKAEPVVETPETEAVEEPAVVTSEERVAKVPDTRPPLRSAASIRKHRRAANRQPVQITWERPDGSSMPFVVTTIVLVAGALVLLALAFYLR